MFDIADFCRICTRAECTLINMLSTDTDNIIFIEKLRYCVAEAINEVDVLPKLICENCCKNLRTSYAFKKVCLKTRTIFCGMLNNDNHDINTPIVFPKSDQLLIKQELITDSEEASQIQNIFKNEVQICSECGTQSSELNELNCKKLCKNCISTCPKCSESFPNLMKLREHYVQQHKPQSSSNENMESSYKCIICNFRYSSQRLLVAHMRVHSGERPYNCNSCSERFAWQHHLLRHVQTQHTPETPITFPCTVCSSSFQNVAQLQLHMREHTGRRVTDEAEDQSKREDDVPIDKSPLNCSICYKVFHGRHKLMIHSRVHSGEKPFECKDCGKRFTQSGYLAYHARIHSGEKPFVCTVCAKCFTQKTTLSTHMRIHLKKNPVECHICKKKVSYKCTLRRHLKLVHGITEESDVGSNGNK